MIRGLGSLLYEERPRELGLFILEEKKAQGRPYYHVAKKMETPFCLRVIL